MPDREPTLFDVPVSRPRQSRCEQEQSRQQRILRAVGDYREGKGKRGRVVYRGYPFDPEHDRELQP